MKRMAIIANKRNLAENIKNGFEAYFGKHFSLCFYTTEEVLKKTYLEEEVVVLSSWLVFDRIKEKLTQNSILDVVSFTLSKENLKNMEAVGNIDRALLINYDYRMCMQVISQLYELGYGHIDFVPYYGDEENRDKSISVAITPNETYIAPPGVKVYDIGDRAVDPNCILRLANKLGIKNIFDSPEAEQARNNVALPQWGLDNILWENASTKNHIRAVIEYIEDGILICDNHGKCYLGNEKAKELLKIDAVDGLLIEDFIPNIIPMEKELDKSNYLVTVDGKKLIATITVIPSPKGYDSYLVIIKNFEETEERQHKIRNKISGKSHEAYYTFNDIIGNSKAIRDAIMLGCRIANSGSSVMIFGESGTGKELMAQSIHNASARKKYNFVALNCAAIPENLLESELFGYEEGAFTGAKKGGKIGYFELAHKGTIFLDEIGEMPLSLQGKLLRVIEERKVGRVGSSKLIDIDVRIIAATNRNMKDLIDAGMFREDLYYRLNVLPIKLPNLNEREEDILVLFDYFRGNMNGKWTYDENVKKHLLQHKWKGNIRELRNAVEYLDNLNIDVITLDDLPEYLKETDVYKQNSDTDEKAEISRERQIYYASSSIVKKDFLQFVVKEGHYLLLHQAVLESLAIYGNCGRKVGRKQVKEWLDKKGFNFTETEIRNSMHRLSLLGYVRVLKGRGGSEITDHGKCILEELKGVVGEIKA